MTIFFLGVIAFTLPLIPLMMIRIVKELRTLNKRQAIHDHAWNINRLTQHDGALSAEVFDMLRHSSAIIMRMTE